ncbi:unnamed protein product [Moneuplotes crassus]|uniref:RING-type domain-containing protein n=1 Tax=Euplotes crassus TaxID=5936 RepID=A0AAD2D394_EUPCR|nr:unnamed protein product [Moneuplotes crassus]
MMNTRGTKKGGKKKVGVLESLDYCKANTKQTRSKKQATKAQLLPYLTCSICQGLFRDAQTINECLCTFCKVCIYDHFYFNKNSQKCPNCSADLGGKPTNKIVSDNTMQKLVDILYPHFKTKDEKIRKELYAQKMIKEGKDPEKENMLKREEILRNQEIAKEKENEANKNFLLLPCNNLVDDAAVMKALPSQSYTTSAKRDIKYIKRFLAHKLGDINWEDIEIYCYDQRLSDNRDLSYIFTMIWKQHKMTKLKPEEEQRILVLHYCKKGTFKSDT